MNKSCLHSNDHRVTVLQPIFPVDADGKVVEPPDDGAAPDFIEVTLTLSPEDAKAVSQLPPAELIPSGVQVLDKTSGRVWGVSSFIEHGLVAVQLANGGRR